MNEPRSNGERYASATVTSDLRMRESGGDVDVIVAAGLVQDGLATALYRLSVEYDAQRAPIDAARRWVGERMSYANALRELAKREQEKGPSRARLMFEAADEAQTCALASLKTEFMLALSAMATLREARERLGAFAYALAAHRRVNLTAEVVAQLAGRTLDAFLEPNCHHCDGRGFSGGGRHEQTGPQLICKPCRGTGTRRVDIGRDAAERRFASHLMMSMDAQMYEVQRAIGRNRRLVTGAKELIARAQAGSG